MESTTALNVPSVVMNGMKMKMISIFDEIAIEAAAKIFYYLFAYAGKGEKPEWVPGGNSLRQDEARKLARKALADAEASLRESGMLQDGQGYHDADGGEAWDATTGGFREPGGFPVAIIRLPDKTGDEK